MEILKDKKILEYYGIYGKRELSKTEKARYIKLKKEMEVLIQCQIEKLFLIDENAWGKEQDKKYNDSMLIVIDKRFKELRKDLDILSKYADEKKFSFRLTSLCKYEKRKNIPTEKEYFIENFGVKIFDSENAPSINERISGTEYAANTREFAKYRRYYARNANVLMDRLLRIYILKLGIPVNKEKPNFDIEVKIAKMISKKDEEGIKLIDEFINENDEKRKKVICKKFEEYIQKIKQVKYRTKLEVIQTMEVYEKLLEKKKQEGKLDIKKLTKEELYIMYVIQQKQTYELCKLYDVPREKIDSKRTYYGIKLNETMMTPKLIEKLIDTANKERSKYAYAFLHDKVLDFEKSIEPILEYMKDGEVYLLKEFWKFVSKEQNLITTAYRNDVTDSFYKAELCIDLLLQNELIEEVDYKQYKITKKGKDFINDISSNPYIENITIPVMEKYIRDFKYFNLQFKEGYPINEQEIKELHDNLREIAYNVWQKNCQEYYPEMLEKIECNNVKSKESMFDWVKKGDKKQTKENIKENLEIMTTAKELLLAADDEERRAFIWIAAFLNTIQDDKSTPETIKNIEQVKDLIYILNQGKVFKFKLPKNIYTKEVYKYIENPNITDIIKLAISNCLYIKNNYEIIEVEKNNDQ